jgi:hypothetical protein
MRKATVRKMYNILSGQVRIYGPQESMGNCLLVAKEGTISGWAFCRIMSALEQELGMKRRRRRAR